MISGQNRVGCLKYYYSSYQLMHKTLSGPDYFTLVLRIIAQSNSAEGFSGMFVHSQRGFVEVKWKESSTRTVHMVGHKGKVRRTPYETCTV